jgi:multicomponent K+:H+ antiporter subunit E
MRRWVPFPLLSLALAIMWLLLNQTLATSHIILGIAFGFFGALSLTALDLPAFRLRRPRVLLELVFVVLQDIVRSNIAVARIILGPKLPREISGFLQIPLELRAPYGLAMLALIITSTPGTLWVSFDSATGILTIHVLDLIDENAWITNIKQRYERRLMEIFE